MALPVRLFIGRSFDDSDEAIVGYFTRHLDQYKDLGLEWFDARPGKSGSTRAKVIEHLEGADAFLGILTRKFALKQRKNQRDSRSVSEYFKRVLKFTNQWTTSGWTFQESGYAVARKLDVMLLVEEGVADVGGLQGDVAVIVFSRGNPGSALGELTGQINSILSKHSARALGVEHPDEPVPPPAPSARSSTTAAERSEEQPTQESSRSPVLAAYRDMIGALYAKPVEPDKAKAALQRGLEAAPDQDEKQFLRLEYLEALAANGDAAAHEELIGLAESEPTRRTQLAAAGRFEQLGELSRALEYGTRALSLESPGIGSHVPVRVVARLRSKIGQREEAVRLLMAAVQGPLDDDKARASLYVCLADLDKEAGSVEEEIAWLELAVRCKPEDASVRFRLAYQLADHGREAQALWHYRILEREGTSAGSLNNLGVTYLALGLKGLGVKAFKAAGDMGESLGLANRADELVGAGFYDEADEALREAYTTEDVNSRVGAVRTRIESARSGESTRLRALEQEAENGRRFALERGEGLLAAPERSQELAGVWNSEFGAIAVRLDGRELVGAGQHDGVAGDLGPSSWEFVTAEALKQSPTVRVLLRLRGRTMGVAGSAELIRDVYLLRAGESVREKQPRRSETIRWSFVLVGNLIKVEEQRDKEPLRLKAMTRGRSA